MISSNSYLYVFVAQCLLGNPRQLCNTTSSITNYLTSYIYIYMSYISIYLSHLPLNIGY